MADPQLTNVDPALQPLIDSLAENTPPGAPGFWPPAPIYWLALIVVGALVVAAVYYRYRTRIRRRYLTGLRQVRHLPDREDQLTRLHALLRNAAGEKHPAWRSLADDAFARRIAATLSLQAAPAWVNAHYRPGAGASVDWVQVECLIRRWCS